MGSLYSVDAATGNLTTAGSITSTSTTSGFLLPRMTTTQRNAISSPTTGLEIFNLTTNQVEFYNGTVWGAVGGGSGTVNPGTLNQLAYYSVSGATLSGSSSLSQTSSGLVLGGTNIGISNTGAYSISSNSLLSLSGSPFVQVNSDLALVSTHNIIFHDDSNSINSINLKGPTSNVTATYTLRMPTSQGGANTFLQNDGSGNLSWGTGAGITGSGSTSFLPKFSSSSVITNSLLADNGAGTFGGLVYQQSTSGQSTYYMTFADNSSALSSHEMFNGHTIGQGVNTNLATLNSFTGNLVIVAGYQSGSDRAFSDLIMVTCGDSGVTAAMTVVTSQNVNSPTTRSYSMSQRTLTVTLSGGASTYNVGVRVMCVE